MVTPCNYTIDLYQLEIYEKKIIQQNLIGDQPFILQAQ